jgi:predicted DCC family thiol-disulfide oxidoreductase YuxK
MTDARVADLARSFRPARYDPFMAGWNGDASRGAGAAGPARAQPRVPVRALLFDGECGICTWLAARARRVDRRGRYAVLPYQDVDENALRPYGVTREDCAQRLYVLEPWPLAAGEPGASRPRVRGGAFGVNVFLWRCFPWSILVALLYLVPPLLLAEVLVYRWVARHRAAISRRLGLRGCRLPG